MKKRQLKEDQFVTTTFQVAGYMQSHRNQVLLGVGGALFLVVVIFLFIQFRSGSVRSSQALLSQGVGMYQAGNYADAAYRLSTFLQSHPRHGEAGYAALVCGDSNFYLNRWDDAERYYRMALEKTREGDTIHFGARSGLAAVEEGRGRPLEAARLYEELGESQDDPERKAHLRFSAARCYRAGGEFSRAAALLADLDETKLDAIDLAGLDWLKKEVELADNGMARSTP
ncbi:MAG: tetratricopeptide repeat protein [Candidatus Eisenbacteria bacterium]|nr:tetratricopeptide repeat protein [Candidatus Eisenbacteria bacterium]